jgi:hypothetical protein
MRTARGLGVDLSTGLGRDVFTLLAGAHVPHVYGWTPGLRYARVLFTNPDVASLHAKSSGAVVVCVQELNASSPREPYEDEVGIAWLAHSSIMAGLMPRLRLALERGRFLSSAPQQQEPYVSEDDLALASATSLASEEIPAGFHAITGPQSLSHEQVVSLASAVFQRPLALEVVALSKLEQSLCELGMSAAEAKAARAADHALMLGQRAESNDTFSRITGLSPVTLQKYLQERRAIWADDSRVQPIFVSSPAEAAFHSRAQERASTRASA